MNYNTRVFVGVAAILLMAVVFAQPGLGQGKETYSSLTGLLDMTTNCLTNPSFEANVVADGQGAVDTYAGWTKNTGSNGSMTYNPTSADIIGAGGNAPPTPTTLPGLGSPSVIPPVGYTVASGGSQVLATWKTAFIAQTVHTVANTASNFTTGANQTYVMTWEYGTPATLGSASGWTVGIFYANSSAFFMVNGDTSFDAQNSGGHMGATTECPPVTCTSMPGRSLPTRVRRIPVRR